MLRRFLRQLQHIVTALALLVAGAVGVELWLQSARPAAQSRVSPEAEPFAADALVPSAVVHHQLRPLATISEGRGCAGFRTNSLGLRGPDPAIPKPPETWRVILLGDDTVSGIWLAEESTLSARLKRYLSEYASGPVEVVNAGVPGYSPLLSLIQYERELSRLEADLIILHFDMSDVADDAVHRCQLREENGQRVCVHPDLNGPLPSGNRFLNLFRQTAVARRLIDRASPGAQSESVHDRYAWTRRAPEDIQLQVRHAMSSVEELVLQTRQRGQPLLISTAPVLWQVIAPDRDPATSARYGVRGSQPVERDLPFQIVDAWSREAGLPFCNPVKAFRDAEEPQELFHPGTARLSEYGMALYGRELAKAILQASASTADREGVRR